MRKLKDQKLMSVDKHVFPLEGKYTRECQIACENRITRGALFDWA